MVYQGQTLTVFMLEKGLAELRFDAKESAVNKFDQQTVTELSDALDALESRNDIAGLLVTSAKKVFVAGADIFEFSGVFAQGAEMTAKFLQTNVENFNRLEDLPFPTVALINGYALGGGFEVALACDARIACAEAMVGLPETTLGIIPGWGGTVRLPRLAGVEVALRWMTEGKPMDAAAAKNVGAVDTVCLLDELPAQGLAYLQRMVAGEIDYLQRRQQKLQPVNAPLADLQRVYTSMNTALAASPYPALRAVVSLVERSACLDRSAALALETEVFADISQTPEAAALVGIFVSEQAISKKARDYSKQAAVSVQHSAVLGAGIMGGGIAYQSALKGVPVVMKDVAQKGLDLGLAEAQGLLSKRVARGQMSEADAATVLARIKPTLEFTDFGAVDMVIEAVVENPSIKKKVLAEVEGKVSEKTILASNTSTISITELATALQRPEQFCGMHFFNPVHAMPLVEVIEGEKTSPLTTAATVAYATAMGKKAIVVQDCPGFLVNRVLFPYLAGFSMLLRDGADFRYVDEVMEKWGWPMGPAYLLDVIGMDTTVHAEAVLAEGFPARMGKGYKTSTDLLFEAGLLGQKTGAGFYVYSKNEKGRLVKALNPEALELLAPHVATPREFSEADIVARMMTPMVTELARCVEEGVVASAAEADMALIYGLGFPRFRGGVFRWVDAIGMDSLIRMAAPLGELGELYIPTPGMRSLLESHSTYY